MTGNLWLLVGPGASKGTLQGEMLNTETGHVAQWTFSRKQAVDRAKELRRSARKWSAAYEKGSDTAKSLFEETQRLGGDVFKAIFREGSYLAVRNALVKAGDQVRIMVKQKVSELEIPWGLLCDPDEVGKDYSFWGVKYNLHVSLDEAGLIAIEVPDPWRFNSAFNDQIFDRVKHSLADNERLFADAIHDRRLDEGTFVLEFEASADAARRSFIYIYAEGEDGKLVFKKPSTTEAHKVEVPVLLDRVVQPGGTALVLLNACNTVDSMLDIAQEFLVPRSGREVACIVTEFQVHNEFALRFGLELVDRCVQLGESVLDAMKVARRRHYPMSIVYSLYCKRNMAVEPPCELLEAKTARQYRAAIEKLNFSDPFRR